MKMERWLAAAIAVSIFAMPALATRVDIGFEASEGYQAADGVTANPDGSIGKPTFRRFVYHPGLIIHAAVNRCIVLGPIRQ